MGCFHQRKVRKIHAGEFEDGHGQLSTQKGGCREVRAGKIGICNFCAHKERTLQICRTKIRTIYAAVGKITSV